MSKRKKKGPKPNLENYKMWEKRVRQWRTSGLTRQEFCRAQGFSVNTLDYYRYKVGLDPKRKKSNRRRANQFLKVQAQEVASRRVSVFLPNGIRVDIFDFDLSDLKKLA